jgi:hypothetical protein
MFEGTRPCWACTSYWVRISDTLFIQLSRGFNHFKVFGFFFLEWCHTMQCSEVQDNLPCFRDREWFAISCGKARHQISSRVTREVWKTFKTSTSLWVEGFVFRAIKHCKIYSICFRSNEYIEFSLISSVLLMMMLGSLRTGRWSHDFTSRFWRDHFWISWRHPPTVTLFSIESHFHRPIVASRNSCFVFGLLLFNQIGIDFISLVVCRKTQELRILFLILGRIRTLIRSILLVQAVWKEIACSKGFDLGAVKRGCSWSPAPNAKSEKAWQFERREGFRVERNTRADSGWDCGKDDNWASKGPRKPSNLHP